MAKQIVQAADPGASERAATLSVHGAAVKIDGDAPEAEMNLSDPPVWVRIGQEFAARRIREYLDETGILPSPKLLEAFQAEMNRRLIAYIEEPKRASYQPVRLKAFEDEMRAGQTNGSGQ